MMDWQFTSIKEAASLIRILQEKCRFEDYELINNELYALCRTDDGRRFIVVCLLKPYRDGWAYTLADESMHPYNYQCPARLLSRSDIPDVSHWRECCWRYSCALQYSGV